MGLGSFRASLNALLVPLSLSGNRIIAMTQLKHGVVLRILFNQLQIPIQGMLHVIEGCRVKLEPQLLLPFQMLLLV